VASSNITPDPSGISYYDQAIFTQAIRTGFVGARKLNQIMPWHTYRGMTDEDIVAMFAYLKMLKPVRHHVDNTEPPTLCKVCRQTHGGGNQNKESPSHANGVCRIGGVRDRLFIGSNLSGFLSHKVFLLDGWQETVTVLQCDLSGRAR